MYKVNDGNYRLSSLGRIQYIGFFYNAELDKVIEVFVAVKTRKSRLWAISRFYLDAEI